MKKFWCVLMALLLVLLTACTAAPKQTEETGETGSASGEEAVLNIYTWEDYVDADTIAAFEAEYGIQVNFTAFASNEEMLTRLEANGGSEYDIIIGSDYIISAMNQKGLLYELDMSKLTNYGNLNPGYLGQFYDPDNKYAIPYTAGTPMIVYDPAVVGFEIDSFSDLWDESLVDSVCLIDDARVTIGAVLKSLGYSYNTTSEEELAEAAAALATLKPNVRMFAYDGAAASLLSGECKVSYMFTPYVSMCLQENPNFVAVSPSEGIGYGIDCLVVPVNAPHPDNAHLFLDFLMRADVAAGVAAYQQYMNPNQAAEPILAEIAPELAGLACYHIPEELFATMEIVQYNSEFDYKFQDVWTNFKLQ